MNPFKKGDKVICTDDYLTFYLHDQRQYTVQDVRRDLIYVDDIGTGYRYTRFKLKETSMNLEDEIQATQEQLTKLQARLEEQNTPKPWPQQGDTYYFFYSHGGMGHNTWSNHKIDYGMQGVGNLYQSKEEAETAVTKRKARVQVLAKIKELNQGWEPDWSNSDQYKHYISHTSYTSSDYWKSNYNYNVRILPNSHYLKTQELAQTLIDSYPSQFLKQALL